MKDITYITTHKGIDSDLKRCILSVKKDMRKSGLRCEHRIYLDGYSLNELDICRRFNNHENMIIKACEKNRGKAACVNQMIREAKGNILCFIDSDDMNIQGRTKSQYELLDKTDIECTGGNYVIWNKESGIYETSKYPISSIDIKRNFWQFPFMLYSSLAIRKESLIKSKLYLREELSAGIDYEFYSRMMRQVKIRNIEDLVCVYKISNQGISKSRPTRQTQLGVHFEVLVKLFSLKGYDSRLLSKQMMKKILRKETDCDKKTYQNEKDKYIKHMKKNGGHHNYFNEEITTDQLVQILDRI